MFDTGETCPDYVYDYSSPWQANTVAVTCQTGFSVLTWLGTFLIFRYAFSRGQRSYKQLNKVDVSPTIKLSAHPFCGCCSVFGLFFIGFGSFGNGVENRSPWRPLIGLLAVFGLVVPVYRLSDQSRGEHYLDIASLLLGSIAMLLHLFNFVVLFFRPETLKKFPLIKRIVASSRLVSQKDLKHAAQNKISLMVKHALGVLDVNERGTILGSHFGRGLHNFAVNIDTVERMGGFKWTWQRSKCF